MPGAVRAKSCLALPPRRNLCGVVGGGNSEDMEVVSTEGRPDGAPLDLAPVAAPMDLGSALLSPMLTSTRSWLVLKLRRGMFAATYGVAHPSGRGRMSSWPRRGNTRGGVELGSRGSSGEAMPDGGSIPEGALPPCSPTACAKRSGNGGVGGFS